MRIRAHVLSIRPGRKSTGPDILRKGRTMSYDMTSAEGTVTIAIGRFDGEDLAQVHYRADADTIGALLATSSDRDLATVLIDRGDDLDGNRVAAAVHPADLAETLVAEMVECTDLPDLGKGRADDWYLIVRCQHDDLPDGGLATGVRMRAADAGALVSAYSTADLGARFGVLGAIGQFTGILTGAPASALAGLIDPMADDMIGAYDDSAVREFSDRYSYDDLEPDEAGDYYLPSDW